MSWLVGAATSPLVLGCAATLLALYACMALAPETAGLLLPFVFANAFTTHFFIWTVLTASFTESSVLKVALDVALLALAARLLEGTLDPLRLGLFTVLVAAGSAVLTSVCVFVGYVITRHEELFFAPTYGFAGVLCGFCVLIKQRAPTEAVLPGRALPAFRGHHLPFAWLCATALARALLGGVEGGMGLVSDLPLAFWALFVSWAYLRFFQHHPDGSIGDGGVDDFRFITLFPRAVQPYLAPVANFCYGFCLLCGLCKDRELALAARLLDDGDDATSSLGDVAGVLSKLHPQQQQQRVQQGSGAAGSSGVAGKKKLGAVKNDPVAERRKQKAMAVLDARLKAMEKDHQQKERAKVAAAQAQQQRRQQGKGEAKGADAAGDDEEEEGEEEDLEASISKTDKAKAGRK